MHAGDELRVVGQYSNCDWLKVITSRQGEGWVSGGSTYVQLQIPCDTIPPGTFRPLTTIIKRTVWNGEGQMTIQNDDVRDAFVVLTSLNKQPVVAGYVRTGESLLITGIPDGAYYLYFSTGNEWNGETSSFTEIASSERSEDEFLFTTTYTNYSSWEVTLYPASGGNTATEYVNPEAFPHF